MAIIVYMRPIWRRGLEGVLQLKQKNIPCGKILKKQKKYSGFPQAYRLRETAR